MDLLKVEAIEVEGTHSGRPVKFYVCPLCLGHDVVTAFRAQGAVGTMRQHVAETHGDEPIASVVAP